MTPTEVLVRDFIVGQQEVTLSLLGAGNIRSEDGTTFGTIDIPGDGPVDVFVSDIWPATRLCGYATGSGGVLGATPAQLVNEPREVDWVHHFVRLRRVTRLKGDSWAWLPLTNDGGRVTAIDDNGLMGVAS